MIKSYYSKGEPDKEILEQIERVRSYLQIDSQDHEEIVQSIRTDKSGMASSAKLLMLDPDEDLLEEYKQTIDSHYPQYDVFTYTSIEEGIEKLIDLKPDIIFCALDFGKKQLNGDDFFKKIVNKELGLNIPLKNFVLMSNTSDEFVWNTLKRGGFEQIVFKPMSQNVLLDTITKMTI
jgi:DNA-binding NarL/FixJ family response regulator